MALATAAGLGLGVLAGMVGGELLGDLGSERVKGAVRRLRRSEREAPEADPQDIERDVVAALIGEGVVDKNPTAQRDLKAVQEAFNAWRTESSRSLTEISRVLAISVG